MQVSSSQQEESERRVPETPELHLLLEWEAEPPRRLFEAGLGSLIFHLALVAGLIGLASLPEPVRRDLAVDLGLEKPVTLVAPPKFELTQKAPNEGKISKQLDLQSLLPKPKVMASMPQPPRSLPALPAAAEPPKIELPPPRLTPQPALGTTPNVAPPPVTPPPPQNQEKPKLAFETPGTQSGKIQAPPGAKVPVPQTSVEDAIKSLPHAGGGTVVGDLGDLSSVGALPNRLPTQGRMGSRAELLSDPMGVDFKPYLIQVLAAVRRNWFAVIPESARMGRRGMVSVQFAISRDGSVPKLVIAMPSGAEALDRAAVAGVSASNPFPPLPPEFRGNEIRLQLTFLYNVPVR